MEDDGLSSFCIKPPRGGYGGGGCGGGTKCGRWNPTSEQVKVLTELFRSGLRTPSTDQIQKLSSQLSFYGKIESKNVFYWFQNHKARERQKRRRVSVDEHEHEHEKENHSQYSCHGGINKNPSSNIKQINEASEQERVIETLQLFPLNSFSAHHESDLSSEKLRFLASDQCKDQKASLIPYMSNHIATHDMMDHPTLDLRLSSFL